MSKTPQFDKAIDEILKDLSSHGRTCKECRKDFQVEKEDIEYYRLFRVPPPALCPFCRKRRRFGYSMRVPKFFKRPCQAPGHEEEVVTVFPPASPHKVVDFSYWWSDEWDPTAYGTAYDPSREFFPEFKKLFFSVPVMSLDKDPKAVNSDYMVGGTSAKNAYYCAMPYHSEDVAYSYDLRFSKDCMDCNRSAKCELCYEASNSGESSRCRFILNCAFCMDSSFLYECKNCSHCFLSSNLRSKQYVFNNEQLTKEEYEKRISAVDLGDRAAVEDCKRRFQELMRKSLSRATINRNAADCIGEGLIDCTKSYFAFYSQNLEKVRYVDTAGWLKDSMDVVNGVRSEKIFDSFLALESNTILFSISSRQSSFLEYCASCINTHHCFGCAGLKNKEFHIFNIPFTEEAYWNAVDGIKTEMLARGEYGELFPLSLGLMPYQSSVAQIHFPLDEKRAAAQGIPWYEEPPINVPPQSRILKAPEEVPARIGDVTDAIVNEVIACEKTGKPFRIIPTELGFYRRMRLPIPTKHPWERLLERFSYERNLWVYPFTCPSCQKQSFSSFTLDEQKKLPHLVCEDCFLKTVI